MHSESMKRLRAAAMLLALICSSAAAMSELELHERLVLQSRKDSAEGAGAMCEAINECAGRVATLARSPVMRRNFEMMLCDAQDAIAKMSSVEAMKVYAASLPRMPLHGVITLCYGLRETPPNADVDAVAAKMLVSGMDFRARTALMDLLGAHKVASARDKIVLGLNPHENPSVQIAACRALAQIPEKKSIPDLIKYLTAFTPPRGRFGFEAEGALRALSGQSFAQDPSTWQHWWDTAKEKTTVTATTVSAPDYNYELSEKQDMYYYEVPVVENRMVLVLDTSGSMIMGGKPSRLDSAKTEMKTFVSSLNDKKMFNIVAFSNVIKRWRKEGLVTGTEANKKDALKYIDALKEGGGTQTILAMEEALNDIAVTNGCECVYLVTDGNPNPWAPNVTAEKQERLMRWLNQALKVRINTIGIYSTSPADKKLMATPGFEEDLPKMQKFLTDIAFHNDGVYRELGKDGTNKVVKIDPKKDAAAMKDKKPDGAAPAEKPKDDPKQPPDAAKDKKDDKPPEVTKLDPVKKDDDPAKKETAGDDALTPEEKKKLPQKPPESDKDLDIRIVPVVPKAEPKDTEDKK